MGAMGATQGAQIAGAGIQSAASAHEAIDMANAYRTEAIRQQRYRNQALSNFNNLLSTSGAGTAQGDMSTGQSNREAAYNDLAGANLSLTKNATTGSARDAAAEQLMGNLQGKLGGYTDWRFNQGLRELAAQRQLGQIGNFAAGTASVFPYRMYSAQHGWDWLRAAGSAISSLGGASQAFNFNGSTPTSGGMPAPGGDGNLDPNVDLPYTGASDVQPGPYVYYQVPQVPQTTNYPYQYYQNIGP